jgi:hypothetical protein
MWFSSWRRGWCALRVSASRVRVWVRVRKVTSGWAKWAWPVGCPFFSKAFYKHFAKRKGRLKVRF